MKYAATPKFAGEQNHTFRVNKGWFTLLPGMALLLGLVVGGVEPARASLLAGAAFLLLMLILRQDQVAAMLVIASSICLDWFSGTYIVGSCMGMLLLTTFFLTRSKHYPWTLPQPLWLWLLFLALTIWPALSPILAHTTTPYDSIYYYPDVIVASFIMFWLGTALSRDAQSLRRFFKLVAAFATFVAIHTIIQELTGQLLFASFNVQAYVASRGNYQLGSSGVSRAGSFFMQPDAGSAFLALMLFLPLCLSLETPKLSARLLYLAEFLLIVLALLFTFSTGAWLAAAIGLLPFFLLLGSHKARALLLACMGGALCLLAVAFPAEVNLLFRHGSDPRDVLLRQGLWETALNIIKAYPLTGIGLSRSNYLVLSEHFRVAAALLPENNPHNAYLELGAMAGLPVLAVFLLLLLFSFWRAFHIWRLADPRLRMVCAGGISALVTLCINNWSFGLWTLPPLVAPGWMLLGALASPLLLRSLSPRAAQSVSHEESKKMCEATDV